MQRALIDASSIKFEFVETDRRIRLVEDYDKMWHKFFARRKPRTVVLQYEDFVSNQ